MQEKMVTVSPTYIPPLYDKLIPYNGGCGCGNFDKEKKQCKLSERPFNADYQDVPAKIVKANNTFVESGGSIELFEKPFLLSPKTWPECEETLTFCRSWAM